MYAALTLFRTSCGISQFVSAERRDESDGDPQLIATIEGCDYRSLAPSAEDMLFYDLLYSKNDELVGMELRILDDRVRDLFAEETQGSAGVTWERFPRLWLGADRWGDPQFSTTELFGDLFLCRAEHQRWAVVIDADEVFLGNANLGSLRAANADRL